MHCSTPIPDDAKFCHSCGSQVSDAEGQKAATASMDSSSFAHMEKLLRDDAAGEFEIDKMLGRGGMAVVYLAKETRLNRKVAIKVLPPELTFGHGVDRFLREAKTAAALDHPNIIPIYRVADRGKIFWYAMKYLEGRSLDDVLKERGKLPLEEAIDILEQVADALDYAHEHKVIHRDIKPANVMLDSRNRVIVTDFGIAKALTEQTLTASGSVVGTPYYMSPEQGMGRPVTGRSDQYSVAVMAYRMISGQVPFEGDSAIDILHKHCMIPPPRLETVAPGLPPHVYQAVHKALEKKAELRFQTVSGFVKALREPTPELSITSDSATVMVDAQAVSQHAAQLAASQAATMLTPRPPGMTAPPTPPPKVTRAAEKKSRRGLVMAAGLVVVLGAVGGAGYVILKPKGTSTAAVSGQQTPPGGAQTPGGDAQTGGGAPAQPAGGERVVAAGGTETAAPTTGRVSIRNLPAGGTVTVDGRRMSGTTFELPPGSHEIRMSATGYEQQSWSGTVVAGETIAVQYSGARMVAAGAQPQTGGGGQVQRQTQTQTQTTPTQPASPPSGGTPGGTPAGGGAAGGGATAQLGILRIGIQGGWARISVDGALKSEQAARVEDTVLPGTHQVKIEREGFVTVDTSITVKAGEVFLLRIPLRPRS
ncbi:MAG TPA: protein kinase [Gemmatimonadales bacterium]|nr:protein kinase [Gemmatimonadales bacterium]